MLIAFALQSCDKDKAMSRGYDMEKVYAENAEKVTITQGVWGTVSFTEGNCMPTAEPASSTCTTRPVQRIVKIYPYTLTVNAVRADDSNVFFESINPQLIAETTADDNGFFQLALPDGKYSIAVVEDGKLYANGGDGNGGICPFTVSSGKTNMNFPITYKAVY